MWAPAGIRADFYTAECFAKQPDAVFIQRKGWRTVESTMTHGGITKRCKDPEMQVRDQREAHTLSNPGGLMRCQTLSVVHGDLGFNISLKEASLCSVIRYSEVVPVTRRGKRICRMSSLIEDYWGTLRLAPSGERTCNRRPYSLGIGAGTRTGLRVPQLRF